MIFCFLFYLCTYLSSPPSHQHGTVMSVSPRSCMILCFSFVHYQLNFLLNYFLYNIVIFSEIMSICIININMISLTKDIISLLPYFLRSIAVECGDIMVRILLTVSPNFSSCLISSHLNLYSFVLDLSCSPTSPAPSSRLSDTYRSPLSTFTLFSPSFT